MASRDSLVGRLATGVSVILGAVLIASVTVVFWPRVAQAIGLKASSAAAPPAYRTGDRIDVPEAWYHNAAGAPTLVIFGREACGACQQAQPFLKDLVSHAVAGRVHVMFAGSQDASQDDARFAKSLGLADESIVTAPEGLRVRLTPTLVLVSANGAVIGAWEGVGQDARRLEISRAIARVH
jgi:thiol-disulfide isomerase/thioredoxin